MTAKTLLIHLRHHTKTKGINDLAEAIDWDKSNVSQVMNNVFDGQNLQVRTLHKISKKTGIGIGQLAEWFVER